MSFEMKNLGFVGRGQSYWRFFSWGATVVHSWDRCISSLKQPLSAES